MAVEKFFFSDLCLIANVASALEGYAHIRSGGDWTIDDIFLRQIDGAFCQTEDPRLFGLVSEALERDFAADIAGQCGTDLNALRWVA